MKKTLLLLVFMSGCMDGSEVPPPVIAGTNPFNSLPQDSVVRQMRRFVGTEITIDVMTSRLPEPGTSRPGSPLDYIDRADLWLGNHTGGWLGPTATSKTGVN